MLTVVVHVVALDQPPEVVERLQTLLDVGEVGRVRRLRGAAGRRFVVSHGALREVLGAVLGVEASGVAIARRCRVCGGRDHGKPELLRGGPRFGLAHSGETALVAVADVEVGVDVEQVRPRPHLAALARRVLTDAEHRAWTALTDAERLPAFLAAWTGKEAFVKGLGVGLHRPLATVAVASLDPPWSSQPLDPGPGYVAAVAAAAPRFAATVRRWDEAPRGCR